IYIRVSTAKEEQKSSIHNQTLLFQQYTAERGWNIVEEYVDIESGTTEKRDNLQRLIADMSKNKFDCILSKELARLSRNGALSYSLRDNCFKHNIHLLTLDGAINTFEDSFDKFGLYTWLYENEAQKTSERTKIALSTLAKQGNFMGSIAPYGYYIKNKQLAIRNDDTPLIVQRIFKQYLDGCGCDKIANQLTADGIPTPSQIAEKSNASPIWHGSTIKLILSNQHYIGNLVQGKETTVSVTCKKRRKTQNCDLIIVENTHDPIITKEMFYAVQNLLNHRKSMRPAPQTRLFSNLLFCMDCGKGMHYRANRKGYVCGTYSKRGTAYCTSHVVKEEDLRDAVLQDINNLLDSTSITYNIKDIKLLLDKQKKMLSKNIRSLKKQLTQTCRENEAALKKMIKGIISREEYNMFISCEEQNTSVIESKLNDANLLLNQLSSSTTLNQLTAIIESKTVCELTPSILNLFVSKIEIGENDSIRIHYKFRHTI
ncbi:recombinase family protein, partial [Zhenhengia yiwuensis]|uniref:recombinase family protein n=1 Tax=Zhenhengia yiwuensis TaxID=2763666 RepID=UPI002A7565F0